MKYIKYFEMKKGSIVGNKIGDIIVYDGNLTPLKKGQKCIIEKIYDYTGREFQSIIKDPDDFLLITNLEGERINFGRESKMIRAHYFTTELAVDAEKYNL